MIKSIKPECGASVNGTDAREARQKSWVALYTRPRSEKKVRAYLDSIGVENYLPVQNQLRQWSDRRKLVETVVIPMVIFASVENPYSPNILTHPLVIRAFTLPGSKEIAKIPDSQIAQLKFILGQSEYPVSFDPDLLRIKDKVRVVRGPLMGLMGEILSCTDNNIELAVAVGIRGAARLNIEKINVEVV
ncbi:MAG: UpxY family transcription antiterminator [Barnesiella sp.]|nr:UpxY family transcription antiterminator [Barnesiella sp.]